MSSIFCKIDDKFVPLYRIIWVAAVPHFCGEEDCQCEGLYEVRLESDESVWASREDRDGALKAIEEWDHGAPPPEEPGPPDEGTWN